MTASKLLPKWIPDGFSSSLICCHTLDWPIHHYTWPAYFSYMIYIYTYLYIDLYNIHHLHVIIIFAHLSFSWTMGLCFDLQTTSPYDTVSFMVGHMFRSCVLYYKPKAHITQKVFSRDFPQYFPKCLLFANKWTSPRTASWPLRCQALLWIIEKHPCPDLTDQAGDHLCVSVRICLRFRWFVVI